MLQWRGRFTNVNRTRKAVCPVLRCNRPLLPQNIIPGTHFLQAERNGGFKNAPRYDGTAGNRTRDI